MFNFEDINKTSLTDSNTIRKTFTTFKQNKQLNTAFEKQIKRFTKTEKIKQSVINIVAATILLSSIMTLLLFGVYILN